VADADVEKIEAPVVIRLIVSYPMIRSLAIRTADTLEDGRAEPSVRDQNRSRALESVGE
jgi:hypothetical protein